MGPDRWTRGSFMSIEASHGLPLTVARAVWVVVASTMVGSAAAGFVVAVGDWELIGSRSIYQAITAAGISVPLVTVLGLIVPYLTYVAVGILIVMRRPRDLSVMVFALVLIAPTTLRPLLALERAAPTLSVPIAVLWSVVIFLLLITLFIFPDGRLVPSWTRFLVVAAAPIAVLISAPMRAVMMLPDFPAEGATASFAVAVLTLCAYSAVGLSTQVYRVRNAASIVQRQQIKLVGFGMGLLFSVLILGFGIPSLFVHTDNAWFAWAMLATVPVFMFVPVSVAVAILRYRLFDIDRIVSRTLTYIALTAILTLVYITTVVLLGQVVGGRSSASVAGATLAVAAVFRTAQRAAQDTIDRRFNRRRYDARRTIEKFGGRLREEVDLASIEEDLHRAVKGTLQPATLALWLAKQSHNAHDVRSARR